MPPNEAAQFGSANTHEIGILFSLEHVIRSAHAHVAGGVSFTESKTQQEFASLSICGHK